MALVSDAAMVLFYDTEGDGADHDDWHSVEHFHERLSVPGFLRATRWVAVEGTPRCMVTYEVEDLAVATSPAYLARLNDPTPWTREIMPRFRGMIRGFCGVAASAGFGLGATAEVVRFEPEDGAEDALAQRLARDVLPAMASRRGMAGVHLLRPAPPPPMTEEQALRGRDRPMPWLIIATGYDAEALRRAADDHLTPDALRSIGAGDGIERGAYALHLTATKAEALRTPKPEAPAAEVRKLDGPRL